MLLRWRVQGDPPMTGNQNDIANLYQGIVDGQGPSSGRLVVLGEPGAGKTVMLSFLISDLIARLPAGALPEGSRVPVMFSLPSCDLGADALTIDSGVLTERWTRWLTSQLVTDYAVTPKQAAGLVREGRVLAVLDGLDEMDPQHNWDSLDPRHAEPRAVGGLPPPRPRAAAVLRALNTGASEPVVLACRRLDYAAIASDGVGEDAPRMFEGRHVMMQPLTPGSVMDFLTYRFPTPATETLGAGLLIQERWEAIWEELRYAQHLMQTGTPRSRLSPIVHVLESPWRIFLATSVFADADTDPGVLLEMPPEDVHRFLLARLIPQVVARDQGQALASGWNSEDVTTWLTAIAVHQRNRALQGWSETDIYLPGLWSLAGRGWPRRVTQALAAFPFVATSGALLTASTFGRGSSYVSAAIFLWLAALFWWAAGLDTRENLRKLNLGGLRTRAGRRHLANWLTICTVCGLALGLATLPGGVNPVIGLIGGTAVGMAVGLAVGLAGDVQTIRTPSALVRQSLNYLVAIVLGLGLTIVLAAWLAVVLIVGLAMVLIAGLMLGLAFERKLQLRFRPVFRRSVRRAVGMMVGMEMWIRYGLGIQAAMRRGMLPPRPARFLDWCVGVGLMRMSGSNPQFRHRELQEHLAADHVTTDMTSSL
jgi:hypothetical protein